jgi:hypothetical protein
MNIADTARKSSPVWTYAHALDGSRSTRKGLEKFKGWSLLLKQLLPSSKRELQASK